LHFGSDENSLCQQHPTLLIVNAHCYPWIIPISFLHLDDF
jgi:hypothetical protein